MLLYRSCHIAASHSRPIQAARQGNCVFVCVISYQAMKSANALTYYLRPPEGHVFLHIGWDLLTYPKTHNGYDLFKTKTETNLVL